MLEAQPQRTLHQTAAALGCDLTEGRGPSDGKVRGTGLRMVQNIRRIETNSETPGFTKPEGLAQVGIEAPATETEDGIVSKIAPLSRRRMLENDD